MGSSLAVSNNWCRKLSTTCIFLGPREVSDIIAEIDMSLYSVVLLSVDFS